MTMIAPKVETSYFPFAGGLDMVSAATLIKPGFVFDASNYEIDSINGGYRRINGYERFDGRTSPSSASYWIINCSITGTIVVGNTVTGGTSAATGKVLQVNASSLILGRVSGTFVSGEALKVSGTTQATATSGAYLGGASSMATDAAYLLLAANDYRTDITTVPGSGRIRGVWWYNYTLYAFRDNAGATAGTMWKSTSSGWSQVTFEYEVSFTAGGGATPSDGATLTQGGVTATVRRVCTKSGAWTGTAAGTLVISVPSGGNFAAGAATMSGGVTLTLSGAQTAITLPAGGSYEFVTYNFTGSTATERMYGCNGVGTAFEFDGSYFVPIHTGMTTDTPSHIACHKNQLFLSFRGSLQNSGIGSPFAWSVILGANEIAIGEDITALLPQPGDASGAAMAVFSDSGTWMLYGSSTSDFKLVVVSPDAGAAAFTAQWIGSAFCLSQRGIQRIETTLAFGNFQFAAVSGLIQPLINRLQGKAISSCTLKEKNQYRLFFSDNSALAMTLVANKPSGVMLLNYAMPVRCYCTGVNSSGREVAFFGSDDGYVYQDSVGPSFDGSVMEYWLRLPFSHFGSPGYRKRFRRAVFDVTVEQYASVSVSYELGAGTLDAAQGDVQSTQFIGGGGYWDQFTWDQFTWDAPAVTQASVFLTGTEKNISMLFYGSSATDYPFSIQGARFQYSVQRIER